MRALTLWQPWASLIALGVKTIETRSWKAPDALIGQRIAIHAAKRPAKFDDMKRLIMETDPTVWNRWFEAGLVSARGELDFVPYGAVVATAHLDGCIPITDYATMGDPECIVTHMDGIDHWIPGDEDQSAAYGSAIPDPGAGLIRDITDQMPFGDYRTCRWAWMLNDLEPLSDPLPATGRQGLWNWSPS